MSDVDMQPSESTRSKVWDVAVRSAAVGGLGVDDGVGGDDAEHRREPRREHARALGHAADGPVAAVAVDVHVRRLRDGVGRHDRDGGVRAAVGATSASTARSTPARSVSMGSRSPMRPVEPTTTSPAEIPSACADLLGRGVRVLEAVGAGADVRAAGVEDDRAARRRPRRPAATRPRARPTTRLVVNTAAPTCSGPSLTTSARSGRPDGLEPGGDAGARKPAAAVTPGEGEGERRRWSRCDSVQGEAERLGQPEREVEGLQGAAGGALDQVVDRGDGDDPAGALVDRDLHERGVGAQRRRGRRPLALGQQVDERLVGVRLLPRGADGCSGRRPSARRAVAVARMPRAIGTSVGVNEIVTSAAPADRRFCAISGMCRCVPPDRVRLRVAQRLAARAGAS